MQRLLGATSGLLGLLAVSQAAGAAECGDVTIASMNWQSAEVLASLDKIILSEGYGCDAEVVIGDTVPTLTSMVEKGEPHIAPEAWVDLVPEVIERGVNDGKIELLGAAISDGAIQGWWIPKYIADAHPDIKTIDDALERPELFPDPEDSAGGAVFNGPQGWGGTLVTSQLFRAYEAEDRGFRLVDTGSSAGLDGSIANAYENKKGWIGYYWSPTALLGKYEMVKLDHGVPVDMEEWKRCTSVAECPDPKRNGWPKDDVMTAVSTEFSKDAPAEVIEYLGKRSWDNATVNALMAWMTDNQATGDEGAEYFLREHEELWTPWVTPAAATKIKASL